MLSDSRNFGIVPSLMLQSDNASFIFSSHDLGQSFSRFILGIFWSSWVRWTIQFIAWPSIIMHNCRSIDWLIDWDVSCSLLQLSRERRWCLITEFIAIMRVRHKNPIARWTNIKNHTIILSHGKRSSNVVLVHQTRASGDDQFHGRLCI